MCCLLFNPEISEYIVVCLFSQTGDQFIRKVFAWNIEYFCVILLSTNEVGNYTIPLKLSEWHDV